MIPALAANNKHTGVERFRVGNKLSLCHFENIAFDLFSLSIQFIQFLRFYLGYLSGLSHKKFCRRFRTVITSCGIYTGAYACRSNTFGIKSCRIDKRLKSLIFAVLHFKKSTLYYYAVFSRQCDNIAYSADSRKVGILLKNTFNVTFQSHNEL